MRGFLFHAMRAVKILARDEQIPQPLRWLAAFGLAPIPGPIDEGALLIVATLFATFYRERMCEAWRAAESEGLAEEGE